MCHHSPGAYWLEAAGLRPSLLAHGIHLAAPPRQPAPHNPEPRASLAKVARQRRPRTPLAATAVHQHAAAPATAAGTVAAMLTVPVCLNCSQHRVHLPLTGRLVVSDGDEQVGHGAAAGARRPALEPGGGQWLLLCQGDDEADPQGSERMYLPAGVFGGYCSCCGTVFVSCHLARNRSAADD
jgi:hypothetical protein